MPQIELLTQETIDKIAAGEVIERPSSVVKELVENAIDAKASAVTVEIKEGGISFIRISDNGCGIEKAQIQLAFLRHSTSKIKSVEDLMTVTSLGFRGEALSSIAAVSQVELITKTNSDFTGSRYLIEGSKELSNEEIGAPDGTTFIIRNLFYNTPARKKFLKAPQTEGAYIHELMQRMILSHPDVAFKFIMNNQVKLQSSGNSNIKDIIYHIYGRDITAALLEVSGENELFRVSGFIGKPQISRGNRNYETYYINGRYIRSKVIAKAIEDAYKPFMMQHQYPMTVLYIDIDSTLLDINVHPTKMELRFSNQEAIYKELMTILTNKLLHKDMIPQVPLHEEKAAAEAPAIAPAQIRPEPFEQKRLEKIRQTMPSVHAAQSDTSRTASADVVIASEAMQEKNANTAWNNTLSTANITPHGDSVVKEANAWQSSPKPQAQQALQESHTLQEQQASQAPQASLQEPQALQEPQPLQEQPSTQESSAYESGTYEQQSFLSKEAMVKQKIIGQLFDTYWLVEYDEKLFIVDQHAAHEKILYERFKKQLDEKEFSSQAISPPVVVTLSMHEADTLKKYQEQFIRIGFDIEHFGGAEYSICGVPANLYKINPTDILNEMLSELSNDITERTTPDVILDKIASMSCKAAVKGNNRLSFAEMEALMQELMQLENPYNCPHGRPTIIAMTKYEIEKKFKRII